MGARRVEGIRFERNGNEIWVAKPDTVTGHALNQSAAVVFELCDGNHSKAQMSAAIEQHTGLAADEAIVNLALNELSDAGLVVLESPAQATITRRSLVLQFALSAAAFTLLPVVETILLAPSAKAQTCPTTSTPTMTGTVTGSMTGTMTGTGTAICSEPISGVQGDFRGCDFRGSNFSGFDLSNDDFQDANLSGANLKNANLNGANLNGASLNSANLKGANLTCANLAGASLTGANLQGADLVGANLTGADLAGANLKGADLMGANLKDANLKGANLKGANLTDVVWSNTICPDRTNSNSNGGTCEGHF